MIPMIGKRFGRWIVLEQVPRPMYHVQQAAWYRCRCDCGTVRDVNGATLRNGNSRSCGCLRNELSRQRLKERQRLKREGHK